MEMYLCCFTNEHPTKWLDYSIRANLLKAQQKMKASYDKHHNELAFQVSDKVLLCLQPSRQASLSNRRHQKLLARFYGPFTILRRIGNLAYELNLPATSKLQPIFHVSLLEPYHEGHNSANPHLPPAPHALQTRALGSLTTLLVHWQHSSPANASWEPMNQFKLQFPYFALRDKCISKSGSTVSKPLQQYQRFSHGKKKQHQAPSQDSFS
ncbi:hypothetical protein MANES_01G061125v8 [Manihot esculenta]|uniref:Uncharacterized protein n=1 Tax=Manihot esculenta TaxID=3983 RepID=A0ACB7IC70_MANES|nr:hypothetical protein MANES_01G061125v8 [Manihot esculenta]